MEGLDTLVEQAAAQAKNALAMHDIEILGSLVITVKEAYSESKLPFQNFCDTFGVSLRQQYPAMPPILLDTTDFGTVQGIGVGLSPAFTHDLPSPFIEKHHAYIIDLPQGQTKYTRGLFVPLKTT